MIHIEPADVMAALAQVPDNTFHGLLSDPPYGLEFMGKDWDKVVPGKDLWAEVYRVLRPGAHGLVFGGTRTFHRLAVALEDAGFEIRDCLMWLYAKGFPKSRNISFDVDRLAGGEPEVVGSRVLSGNAAMSTADKGGTYGVQVGSACNVEVAVKRAVTEEGRAWEGWGTALKPCWEPILLVRKPLAGTIGANARAHGSGALNISGARIGDDGGTRKVDPTLYQKDGNAYETSLHGGRKEPTGEGRWPANLLLDEDAAEYLDDVVGDRPSNPYRANVADGAVLPMRKRTAGGTKERGLGPSRFFFSAKVSTREREAGCEHLVAKSAGEMTDREDGSDGLNSPRAGAGRTGGARNNHPTLKPIDLNRYLATLLLPPPHVAAALLVPFSGAGSEVIGAARAGWGTILGIEQSPEYVEIANARIRYWTAEGR